MFLNPSQIVDNLDLKPGNKVADLGCGPGMFSFLLSKKVEDTGKVFSVDSHKEILEKLNREKDKLNIVNIETIFADIENKIELESGICDLVVLSNILSLVGNIDLVLKEAKRILKKRGSLLVIEWKDLDHHISKKRGHILKEEEVLAILAREGFSITKHVPAGDFHYAFLAIEN